MRFTRVGLLVLAFGLGIAAACPVGAGEEIRPPAVAGRFYPESASTLKLAIEKFMQDALPARVKEPLAIVVPHAGYIFSGQICADGYN